VRGSFPTPATLPMKNDALYPLLSRLGDLQVRHPRCVQQSIEYIYRISRPIRRTVIFSLGILEKSNDESILILVIYWKKTGLLHTKISNHNIIYSS